MEEKTPIRTLCEKYEMTQAAFAQRFGIPLRTVEDWVAGKRKPPEYVVAMIQTILEYDIRAKRAESEVVYSSAVKAALVASGKVDEILQSPKAQALLGSKLPTKVGEQEKGK